MEKAILIIEKYLNENFWVDHLHPNGYPTKVMTKTDFLGMLNELKTQTAKQKETPPAAPENVTFKGW